MYGLINRCIELLVVKKFGVTTWESIKSLAGVNIDGTFSIYGRYDDSISYNLVFAAEKVLGVPAGAILELFGEFFYEFCVESGYASMLKLLAPTPMGFLESLDSLHDHLGSSYCGMQAPSFRCTKVDEHESGESKFYLHYHSHRPALAPVVVGIVRSVCRDLFEVDADLTVVMDQPLEEGEVCFLVNLTTGHRNRRGSNESSHEIAYRLSHQPLISPSTFANLFPFHLVFDRRLQVVQLGNAIARLFLNRDSDTTRGCEAHTSWTLDAKFVVVRPKIQLTFSNILAHINTVYVLSETEALSGRSALRLKGQMIYLAGDDLIVYIASPSAANLQQIFNGNLHLSDIPVHDATRNLVTMSEHFNNELQLSHELEILTNTLQLRYREVEIEKEKTERLVYASFPPSIVGEMKKGHRVPARHYETVTVMFTGINGFQRFCVENEPITVVKLLNDCFTEFDAVLDPEGLNKVYKVETIADHYMCGCPDDASDHAGSMLELAVRLMSAGGRVTYQSGQRLEITIGIHTGEIVAGVIGSEKPRFCLFGDTVNTTSRTEAYGKRGYINLTQYTHDQLQREDWRDPLVQLSFHSNATMKGKPDPMPLWIAEITDGAVDCEKTGYVHIDECNLDAKPYHDDQTGKLRRKLREASITSLLKPVALLNGRRGKPHDLNGHIKLRYRLGGRRNQNLNSCFCVIL